MARVRIEDIVDHLSSEMRRALADAVGNSCPGCTPDAHQLFRDFKRAVGRKCSTWERVPDTYVDKD